VLLVASRQQAVPDGARHDDMNAIKGKKLIRFAMILALAGLGPASALAQQPEELPWYEQRHGELRLGGFFITSIDTQILLESNSNPLAATINFQRELGLDTRATVTGCPGAWAGALDSRHCPSI